MTPLPARKPEGALRRGWTTGACATAALRAALTALIRGAPEDPVAITLPRGERPRFALAAFRSGPGWAEAGIVKDAGDDPDVTHGALILTRAAWGAPGSGIRFHAGEGVGIVTRPGLPLAVGEPAINPAPRAMMTAQIDELAPGADLAVTIAIPGGAAIARRTWNPRLGIRGGLSVLGTTGVVRPYSCAAWIASIHRGIDVARAAGLDHLGAATGSTSEAALRAARGLPDHAMLDMGDFAGGVLKYLARHPVARLSIAGGIGKMAKLAQGALDLHSARSQVDMDALAGRAGRPLTGAGTALEALELAGPRLADAVAEGARATAEAVLAGSGVAVEVLVVDRQGRIVGRSCGF
ncbi:MAG: cobalt-precorrin-5B (C(1))-methyltransferase [Alphaproteobacteria bacterium]|nr:MAG: cobalt-precorrin-5B (C(1))-methyltransferase [Alphaproteobacteria bacterium]